MGKQIAAVVAGVALGVGALLAGIHDSNHPTEEVTVTRPAPPPEADDSHTDLVDFKPPRLPRDVRVATGIEGQTVRVVTEGRTVRIVTDIEGQPPVTEANRFVVLLFAGCLAASYAVTWVARRSALPRPLNRW